MQHHNCRALDCNSKGKLELSIIFKCSRTSSDVILGLPVCIIYYCYSFDKCTVTCGRGIQTRSVTCDHPDDGNIYACRDTLPHHTRNCTLKDCPGKYSYHTRNCTLKDCPGIPC